MGKILLSFTYSKRYMSFCILFCSGAQHDFSKTDRLWRLAGEVHSILSVHLVTAWEKCNLIHPPPRNNSKWRLPPICLIPCPASVLERTRSSQLHLCSKAAKSIRKPVRDKPWGDLWLQGPEPWQCSSERLTKTRFNKESYSCLIRPAHALLVLPEDNSLQLCTCITK